MPTESHEGDGARPAAYVVTPDNYVQAQNAIRDILLMYVGLAEDGCFTHAADHPVRFDRLAFVDAEMDCQGYAPLVDLDLLRTGSAIAALCFTYDLWCEFEAVDIEAGRGIRQALAQDRFRFVPDVEGVLREALERNEMTLEDPWFDEAVRPIHQRHVVGYFTRLAGGGDPASKPVPALRTRYDLTKTG